MSDVFNAMPSVPPAQPPKKDYKLQIIAASLFALAIAILVFAIAMPSGSDSGKDRVTADTAGSTYEKPAATTPVNKYDSYYQHVLNNSGRANSMSKSDVIQLGDLVCQAFDDGNSVAAVVDVMSSVSSNSSDIELAAAAMWGATEYICPEYKPMMQAYLNN